MPPFNRCGEHEFPGGRKRMIFVPKRLRAEAVSEARRERRHGTSGDTAASKTRR